MKSLIKSLRKLLLITTSFFLFIPYCLAKIYEEPINVTGFADLFVWADKVLEYKFGIGILMIVGITSFILLKGYENKEAFAGSLFFTMMVSIGFRFLGIVNDTIMISTIILCALAVLLIMWSS